MRMYSTVVVDNEAVRQMRESDEFLPYLKRHLANKLAEKFAEELIVYQRVYTNGEKEIHDGMTQFECAINIEFLKCLDFVGVHFAPVEEEDG